MLTSQFIITNGKGTYCVLLGIGLLIDGCKVDPGKRQMVSFRQRGGRGRNKAGARSGPVRQVSEGKFKSTNTFSSPPTPASVDRLSSSHNA